MSEKQSNLALKVMMLAGTSIVLILLLIISAGPPRQEHPKGPQPILFSEHSVPLGDPGLRRELDPDRRVIVIMRGDLQFIFGESDVAEGEVINLGDHFITFSTLNGLLLFKNESPDRLLLIKTYSDDKAVLQNTRSPLQQWDPETGQALIPALEDLKPVLVDFRRWGDVAESLIEKNGRVFFPKREQLKREKLPSGRN